MLQRKQKTLLDCSAGVSVSFESGRLDSRAGRPRRREPLPLQDFSFSHLFYREIERERGRDLDWSHGTRGVAKSWSLCLPGILRQFYFFSTG
ncbi:hypothetical protein ElyMa_005840900 [Elysia marginata]|uniref:Uncharacterized protein n=1 Tax=Elysia marginata TaxID=1093978 RepID=A0AAV4FXS9_9GAST|nr:hypothetical protein ElyMa_005840900 [Elysia marginata]